MKKDEAEKGNRWPRCRGSDGCRDRRSREPFWAGTQRMDIRKPSKINLYRCFRQKMRSLWSSWDNTRLEYVRDRERGRAVRGDVREVGEATCSPAWPCTLRRSDVVQSVVWAHGSTWAGKWCNVTHFTKASPAGSDALRWRWRRGRRRVEAGRGVWRWGEGLGGGRWALALEWG